MSLTRGPNRPLRCLDKNWHFEAKIFNRKERYTARKGGHTLLIIGLKSYLQIALSLTESILLLDFAEIVEFVKLVRLIFLRWICQN